MSIYLKGDSFKNNGDIERKLRQRELKVDQKFSLRDLGNKIYYFMNPKLSLKHIYVIVAQLQAQLWEFDQKEHLSIILENEVSWHKICTHCNKKIRDLTVKILPLPEEKMRILGVEPSLSLSEVTQMIRYKLYEAYEGGKLHAEAYLFEKDIRGWLAEIEGNAYTARDIIHQLISDVDIRLSDFNRKIVYFYLE
ncbi:MAG: hypothetical protein JXA94_04085 [Parachlamydiales bacterium]|nr:hypothetical protein [Parachlamydiales bacterium]